MSSLALSGVASGLDTQSIITQLMALEKQPLDQIKARQTAHTSRMSSVASVKDLISSLQAAAKSLADRSKMNAKIATTDTPSTSPTVLTASATADAINGSFKVTVSQLATSTRIASSGPLGTVVDANATLANAGLRYSPTMGTFRINGQALTIDGTTTLNSLVSALDGLASIDASLVADADGRAGNRVQLISAPGQSIQMGSLGDTSNGLRLLNLSDAAVTGYSASSANSGVAVDAGTLNTSITINGVTTTINQANGGFSAAQNAQAIAQAINDNTNNTVTAVGEADGTITLTQKTLGSQQTISVTDAGTGTGLAVGTTQTGRDRVVSTASLGMVNVGASLANARMVTPISGLVNGSGSFKINDVEITYKDTDSITSIINRINASTAGATAFYDPIQDRLRLTASQTGARTMTLEDVQGDFLAATNVLSSTQQLGQNALFSIDSVNGGQQLTSSTNSVSGYIPGVTLDLKSTSATPVTVTVNQDPNQTMNAVKTFVNQFNTVLTKIEDLTKYDAENKRSSVLSGDSGMRDIQRQLRQMTSSAALGATGTYRSLASIGVSFGVVGSAVGTTNRLTVDDAKLSKALAENPQAVEAVLAGFGATLGTPTSTTNITAVSGTPQIHQDGKYFIKVTDASTGAVDVRFETTSGQKIWESSGILAAGQDNFAIIPGLKITAPATLTQDAEDSFSISVTNRGVGVAINDYLNGLLDSEGYFADRKKGDDRISSDFNDRIATMQDRLDRKEASLKKKYATLETTLSRMNSQGSALSAQLAKLNAAG